MDGERAHNLARKRTDAGLPSGGAKKLIEPAPAGSTRSGRSTGFEHTERPLVAVDGEIRHDFGRKSSKLLRSSASLSHAHQRAPCEQQHRPSRCRVEEATAIG